jgi:hypothetical protein
MDKYVLGEMHRNTVGGTHQESMKAMTTHKRGQWLRRARHVGQYSELSLRDMQ